MTPLIALGGAFVGFCIAKVTDTKFPSALRFLAWLSAVFYVGILCYFDQVTAGLIAAGIALIVASIAISIQALVNILRRSAKAKAL